MGLALFESLDQLVGRDVDDLYLGVIGENVGHGLTHARLGEAGDDVVVAFDMLDLERGDASILPLELVTGASKVREGKATRLVLTDPAAASMTRDNKLVALLAEARATRDMVLPAPDRSLREIAAEQGSCRHRIAKLIRLSWLSPEIATAIVEGRQPRRLTARRLLDGEMPIEWSAQEDMAEVRYAEIRAFRAT